MLVLLEGTACLGSMSMPPGEGRRNNRGAERDHFCSVGRLAIDRSLSITPEVWFHRFQKRRFTILLSLHGVKFCAVILPENLRTIQGEIRLVPVSNSLLALSGALLLTSPGRCMSRRPNDDRDHWVRGGRQMVQYRSVK